MYVNDVASLSHHVELAPLINHLKAYLSDQERHLTDWRIATSISNSTAMTFARAARRSLKPRPIQLLGGGQSNGSTRLIVWVVTLDRRLIWSDHIDRVRKKDAHMMGVLGPLLNRRRDLSVRNCVLLYKQLIRPMMDCACPVQRFAARTHAMMLQVLQSKCLRLAAGAPWYIGNRQIHDDLGVPSSPTTSEP